MGTWCPHGFFGVRGAHSAFVFAVVFVCALAVDLLSPCAPPRKIAIMRSFRRGLSEHAVRVPQPRLIAFFLGNPAGAVNRGRLFLGYFLFGEAKESD